MATKKDEPQTTGAPHEATWGMTEAAKADWETKHGSRIRREKAKDKETEE